MHRFRPLAILLLALGMWFPVATQVAHAAPSTVTSAADPVDAAALLEDIPIEDMDVHCRTGLCTMRLGVPELDPFSKVAANIGAALLLQTAQENIAIVPENTNIEISDDVQISLPVGDLQLLDAQLVLERGATGELERLRGTAEVPFPALPWLSEAQFDAPLRADIGLELGEHLAHLGAPLDPERAYLFLNFDAGMRVSAPFDATGARALTLSVPRGQNATLIIDPQEPFVYLAGHITMSHAEQVALLGQLLDPEQTLAFVPDTLPMQELVTVQVNGAWTDEMKDAFLRVGGGFSLRSASTERWFGMELTPLSVYGLMTLSHQGVWLNGLASSSIHPERLLDGAVQAEIFVPFADEWSDAYVQLDGGIDVPLIGVYRAGATRLAAPAIDEPVAVVADAEMAAEVVETEPHIVPAAVAQPRLWHRVPAMTSLPGTLSSAVVNGASQGYQAAANVTKGGYIWMSDGVAAGYDAAATAVTEGALCGWQQTERTWCSITGLCESAVSMCGSADVGPVAAAE